MASVKTWTGCLALADASDASPPGTMSPCSRYSSLSKQDALVPDEANVC